MYIEDDKVTIRNMTAEQWTKLENPTKGYGHRINPYIGNILAVARATRVESQERNAMQYCCAPWTTWEMGQLKKGPVKTVAADTCYKVLRKSKTAAHYP